MIPLPIKRQLERDPFMKRCIYHDIGRGHECANQFGGIVIPTWEHAWIYANNKVQEWWAILPVCWYHHQGGGMDKDYHRYRSILRAPLIGLIKYPLIDWVQKAKYLDSVYAPLMASYARAPARYCEPL